jgi:hypothetical protein
MKATKLDILDADAANIYISYSGGLIYTVTGESLRVPTFG